MKCRILMMLVCMITCMASLAEHSWANLVEIDDNGYEYHIFTDCPDYGCIDRIYGRQRARLLGAYELKLPESVIYDGQEYLMTELATRCLGRPHAGEPKGMEDVAVEVITLHDNFKLINAYNFNCLKNVKEVNIGASMEQIICSFNKLPSLERINIAVPVQKSMCIWESFNWCDSERIKFTGGGGISLSICLIELPNLREIDLHGVQEVWDSVTDIPLLEEVVIEPEMYVIDDRSFCNLASLEKIIFKHRNAIQLGCSKYAFRDNPSLKDVFVEDEQPFVIAGEKEDTYEFLSGTTLHVPVGTKELYAAAPVWCEFAEIVEYEVSGAEVATADGGELKCRANGSGIEVTAPQGAMINVTAIDGRTMTQVASAGEPVVVELPAGIYVVTSAGQSTKVCVR